MVREIARTCEHLRGIAWRSEVGTNRNTIVMFVVFMNMTKVQRDEITRNIRSPVYRHRQRGHLGQNKIAPKYIEQI